MSCRNATKRRQELARKYTVNTKTEPGKGLIIKGTAKKVERGYTDETKAILYHYKHYKQVKQQLINLETKKNVILEKYLLPIMYKRMAWIRHHSTTHQIYKEEQLQDLTKLFDSKDEAHTFRDDVEIMDEYINKNNEEIKQYKKDLKIEINKLVLIEWKFLSYDWKKITNKYKHRTELKNVKNIEELTSGFTSKNIKKYMPHSSFYAVYKKFRITNYESLNKYVNYCLYNMFSNIKIRILSALIKNPKNYKNITTMLDGHNTTIEYDKPDISTQKKWSYKLKSSGIRTQVLIDINEMVLSLSDSQLCGNSSDSGMFLNMKLYNKIKEQDCVALDGGYTLFIKQFENLCKDKNINLDDKNFFYPIRKENGIALNAQEEHYTVGT
ncbi:hypothetical protein BDF21DRAFT_468333 [Thamnidium elegans]|nr:hypothetical protein BDF21DRAFT_468333 [Thamnidium elegans]